MFTQLLFFYSRELNQHTCQVFLFVLTNPWFQNSSSPQLHIPRTAPSSGCFLTQELLGPTPEVQSHHLLTSRGNEWENSRMVEHPPPLATCLPACFCLSALPSVANEYNVSAQAARLLPGLPVIHLGSAWGVTNGTPRNSVAQVTNTVGTFVKADVLAKTDIHKDAPLCSLLDELILLPWRWHLPKSYHMLSKSVLATAQDTTCATQ